MCGITGWVDYSRDLTGEVATLQAMTAVLAPRGPDADGTWCSEHAMVGHRRLAVLDLAGGRQPMVHDDVVITYGGEVYNYRELRSDLEAVGHEFRTASDTEVVLHAYLAWGSGLVHRLNGMYAFAIWDARREELLLVRDRLGVKPLFYHRLRDGLIFGSEPKAILANPLVKATVDPSGFCGVLTGTPTPGLTPFSAIRELPPGSILKMSRHGLSEQRYWALPAYPHEDDEATTVAKVRDLLEDIVSRQMLADVPLCFLLSGGLDSSALTALGQRASSAHGDGPVHTFTVDFAGLAERFQPDALRATRDLHYAHQVAQHVGSQHRDIVLDTNQLLDPQTRLTVLRAWDMPLHLGEVDVSVYLLFQAIREQATVVISGQGADEVFGGYPWMHNDAAINLPIFPWMAAGALEGATPPFSLLRAELIERLGVYDYVSGLYRDSLAEVPHLDGEPPAERRMREVNYLHLTCFIRHLLNLEDRMSMAVGLEVRVPFCDHRLVEYVFNAPWSMKTGAGREKSLLQQATEDLLPRSVVERRKAPFPAPQDPSYDRGLQAALKTILDGAEEPIRPLLDLNATRALVENFDVASSRWDRLKMECVVRTNQWLGEYNVDLGPL
jgi:asparagine synthase (glutamine-hydrolysing)